jgi:hypothetical protein
MGRSAATRGLVGVVVVFAASALLPRATAATTSRILSVPAPAPGRLTVAVVRFPARAHTRVGRLRRIGSAPRGGSSAFVLGTARTSLPGHPRIGLVAIVNFGGTSSQRAIRRRISASRGFVVDFVGDPERYRGKLAAALTRITRRGWTVDALELPPASADPAYRSPRVLLDQVRRFLIGKPDAAFVAALRGRKTPSQASPPPAPAPPPPSPPLPAPALVPVSSDTFTNSSSAHRTQVEPDSFAFGSTVVTAFQSGRFYDGGASDIGFAKSDDVGHTWTNGFLPGLTTYLGSGAFDRASDPTVAYDAKHGVWLIASIGIQQAALPDGAAVVVSRSTDGGTTWGAPVTVATGMSLDKEWIVCDNHPASPFYGRCYMEWDAVPAGETIEMSTSVDGGATWGTAKTPAGTPKGYAGQPLVLPSGRVVVPFDNPDSTALLAFDSPDGGVTWTSASQVTTVSDHEVAGDLRTEPIPSAEIDGGGTIYVVWQDCRFRPGCSANDLVMASKAAGDPSWSPVTRIPIDSASSTVDHFIPGLGVDPGTSGPAAHLSLAFYYYPQSNCTDATCELDVGLVSSADAGATWTAPLQLAGPMSIGWLPPTTGGSMVGDYISTSYVAGTALPFFAVANAPSGGSFDEAIYTR